jgi:Mce-associated membrane protein
MTRDNRRLVLAAMTALAVAAAACAGWFGWSWLSAAHSASLAEARTRDTVLQQAEQGVVNLNTLDYRHATASLRVWLASSTGGLHSELAKDLQQEVKQIEQGKAVTTAKVLDGAVTQLAVGPGTATVMVAVEITVTSSGGSPSDEAEGVIGQLKRGPSGWKLSSLGAPPGAAGTGASPSPSSSPSPSPSPTT